MAEYKVGTAKITVRPDLEGDHFRRSLNHQWNRMRKEFEKDQARDNGGLKVEVNQDHLKSSIAKANTQLDGLVKRKRTIDVTAKFKRQDFVKQLKTALNDVQNAINVDADTSKVEKKLDKASAKRSVKMDLDESALDKYMKNRRNLGIATLQVQLKGDADAENRLNAIARDREINLKINRIGDDKIRTPKSTTAEVRVTADLEGLRKKIEGQTKINPVKVFGKLIVDDKDALKDRHVNVNGSDTKKVTAKADTTAAKAEFAALTRPETKRITAKVDTRKGKSELEALTAQVGTIGNMLTRQAFVGSALTVAGIGAAGAVPSLTAFGSALASIAKTSLVAPAGIGAVATSFGALKLATNGLFGNDGFFGEKGGFANLASLAQDGELSAEGFAEATDGLNDKVKEFAVNIFDAGENADSFYDSFKKIGNVAQGQLFEGINQALFTMKDRLYAVNDAGNSGFFVLGEKIAVLNRSFGNLVKNWSDFRFSDQGWADLNLQMANTQGAMTNIVGAMDRWNVAWNNISTVGSAFLPDMTRGIRLMVDDLARWTIEARQSGEMTRMIEDGITSAKNVGHAAVDVFRIMGDVLHAAGVNAKDTSKNLEDGLSKVKEWTGSLEGQNTLVSFFENAKNVGQELAKTLGTIGQVIATDVMPILSDFVQGLGPGLREAIGGASPLLDAIAPSARGIGEAVGQMAVGFNKFGEIAAPIISGILPIITTGFKELAPVIGALAGPTTTLMLFSTAVKKLTPVMSAFSYMFAGAGGWAAKALALGVSFGTLTNTLNPMIKAFTSLNDALGGIPANMLAFLAIAKQVNALMGSRKANAMADGITAIGVASEKSGSKIKVIPNGIAAAGIKVNSESKKMTSSIVGVGGAVDKANGKMKNAFAPITGASRKAYNAQMELSRGFTAVASNANRSSVAAAASISASQAKFKAFSSGAKAGLGEVGHAAGRMGNSLSAALGGPWLIGITTGIAALSAFKSNAEATRGAIDEMGKSLDSVGRQQGKITAGLIGGGTLQESTTPIVQDALDANKNRADKNIGNMDRFRLNTTWGDDSQEFKELGEARDSHDNAEAAKKRLDELGYSAEELSKKVTGSSADWKDLQEELGDSRGGREATKILSEVRDSAEEADRKYNSMSDGAKRAASVMSELNESNGMASGSVNKFRQALMYLNGSQLAATDATAQMTNTLDMTRSRMDSFAGATLLANGRIDATTSAGAALHEELKTLGDSMGNAVEAGEDANTVFGNSSEVLEQMRLQTGMTEQEWQKLLESYQMTPEKLETVAEFRGDKASQAILELQAAIEGTQDYAKPITMTVDDSDARANLEDLGFKVDVLDEKTGLIDVHVNSDEARQRLETINSQMEHFSEYDLHKVAGLDVSKFDQGAKDILDRAGLLNETKTEIRADLNTDEFSKKQQSALAATLDLNNMTALPTLDLNDQASWKLGELSTKLDALPTWKNIDLNADSAQTAGGLVDMLAGKVVTLPDGSVDIDSLSASGALDICIQLGLVKKDHEGKVTVVDNGGQVALDILRNIKDNTYDKSQTITTTHREIVERAEYFTSTGRPANSAGPYLGSDGQWHADGGRLPKNSSGSRLPTTGPGTDKTDGILGVAPDGTPLSWVDAGEWIINADSSEKYNAELAAINAGTFPKLPGFAGGGIMDKLQGALASASGAAQSAIAGGVGMVSGVASSAFPAATGSDTTADDPFAPIATSWENTQTELLSDWSNFQTTATTAWSSIQSAISTPWDTATGQIMSAWTGVQQFLTSQWSSLQATTGTVWQGINTTITQQWTAAGQSLQNVYNGAMVPMFNALQGSLITVQGAFSNAVNGIGAEFQRIQELTAAPTRYTIGTVFNTGLVGMWNSASDLLGTSKMNPYPVAFATGGHVEGPGTETSDSIPAMLSDGEYVMRAKAVKAIGLENLNALNSGNVAFAANAFNDKTFEDMAIHRASGGPVKGTKAWDQLKRGYDWAKSRDGRPYVWGGSANGSGGADCSGFMSGIADVILGGDGTRQWATMSFPGGQAGAWAPGLSAGFSVGISAEHTAGTIGGVEGMPAVNVESGGSNGGMAFGRSTTVGADDGQFPNKQHMIITDGGAFKPGMGRNGGPSIQALLEEKIKPWQEKLDAQIAAWSQPGLVNTWPKATGSKMKSAAENKMNEAASAMQAMAGAAGVDLTGVSGDVVNQVREVFKRHGWDGDQWDAAQWIIGKESGWNPQATNPSSGAYGLFQFLGPTKDQYLPGPDYSVPTQADAGARYIKDRYGNPIAAKAFWEANNWYDDGGYLQPGVTRANNETGKPEPVFTAEQWQLLRKAIITNFQNADWDGVSKNLSKAAEVIQEAFNKVDWQNISDHVVQEAVSTFKKGQTDDALGVFGIGGLDSIPLYKAGQDLDAALNDGADAERKEREQAQKTADDKAKADADAAKAKEGAGADSAVDTQVATNDSDNADSGTDVTVRKAPAVEAAAEPITGEEKPVPQAPTEADLEPRNTDPLISQLVTQFGPQVHSASQFIAQAAGMAAPALMAASAINPAFGTTGAAVGAVSAGANVANATTTNNGATYNIYTDDVSDGLRKAKMYERQSAAQSGLNR